MGRIGKAAVLTLLVALLGTACGAEDPDAIVDSDVAPEDGDGPVANACPAEGCTIEIVEVAPEGDELQVTWEANFLPDVSRNHIHVYWDLYSADQVSADADARGVEAGEWVVTDNYPTFVTESAVSVSVRDDSTMLCVTAADRDHAVIDTELVHCRDVSDALES